MDEPKTVESENYRQNSPVDLEKEKAHSGLDVSIETQRAVTGKVVYSIIIVCLSSFFFGFCLSSSDFFIENFNEKFMISDNVSFMDKMKGDQMMSITDNSMDNQMVCTTNILMNNSMMGSTINPMNNSMMGSTINPMNNLMMDGTINPMSKHNGSSMNDTMNSEVNMESTLALTSTEISWFLSIILLGALFGNIIISSFHLNRKLVIMINNFLYLVGVIVMYYSSHAAPLIIGKFIWGIASGISCAYVPAYLTELKIYRWSGTIGSVQSVLVTLGILFGYLLEICFHSHRLSGFIVVCSFLLVHAVSLIFVLNTKSTKDAKNMKSLFKNRGLWKSVIISSTFHFTQQASGVNVVLVCASILLLGTNASKYSPVFVGLTQFLATLIAMLSVDILGRKPLMIISVAGVIISLSIIAFSHFVEIGMYSFMIFFSIGLGPITWFITGELVPPEYRDATNQIATSMNWLSAFVAVRTQEYLFKTLGAHMFTIYLTFMCIYLIYLIVFFKGTTGRPPSFL